MTSRPGKKEKQYGRQIHPSGFYSYPLLTELNFYFGKQTV